MQPVVVFSSEHLVHVCLNRFPDWGDFDVLARRLDEIEGFDILSEPVEGPYSTYQAVRYLGVEFTHLYDGETGNCFQLQRKDLSPEQIELIVNLAESIDR